MIQFTEYEINILLNMVDLYRDNLKLCMKSPSVDRKSNVLDNLYEKLKENKTIIIEGN